MRTHKYEPTINIYPFKNIFSDGGRAARQDTQ